jgi:hypothetical protein
MKMRGIYTLLVIGVLATSLQAASVSNRSFNPTSYTPGSPVSVTVTIAPDPSVYAYALEETPPAGWTITGIDNDGVFQNGIIKWGVFFDDVPRTLRYEATPSLGTAGTKSFSGLVSYDGASSAIGGSSSIPGEGAAAGPDTSSYNFKTVIRPLKGETINIPDNSTITSVSVHDAKGREIKNLDKQGGEFVWDGKNQSGKIVASGIYILILKDGGSSRIVKVSVIK